MIVTNGKPYPWQAEAMKLRHSLAEYVGLSLVLSTLALGVVAAVFPGAARVFAEWLLR